MFTPHFFLLFTPPPPQKQLESLIWQIWLVFCEAALFWNSAGKWYSEKKLKLEFASQNTLQRRFLFLQGKDAYYTHKQNDLSFSSTVTKI